MKIKTSTGEIEINVVSLEFQAGYETGSNHPVFLIGNTLKDAPESDDINPYEPGSVEYWNWRMGFNSAIL